MGCVKSSWHNVNGVAVTEYTSGWATSLILTRHSVDVTFGDGQVYDLVLADVDSTISDQDWPLSEENSILTSATNSLSQVISLSTNAFHFVPAGGAVTAIAGYDL